MKLNETSLHYLHVARVSVPGYQIISLYHATIPVPRWMLPDHCIMLLHTYLMAISPVHCT